MFELVKLTLILAPVRGHPEAGQAYRLYTDASDYAVAGALQQVQLIAIKDLKGTRVHKRLLEAYTKGEPVPVRMASLYSALFVCVCVSLLLHSHVAKYYATTAYA